MRRHNCADAPAPVHENLNLLFYKLFVSAARAPRDFLTPWVGIHLKSNGANRQLFLQDFTDNLIFLHAF